MSRKTENSGFTCINCNKKVTPIPKGTIRNHCPFCLYSLHVDIVPGDRAGDCRGLMVPAGVELHSAKGRQILHRCALCGHVQKNIAAEDDDIDVLAEVMRRAAYRN